MTPNVALAESLNICGKQSKAYVCTTMKKAGTKELIRVLRTMICLNSLKYVTQRYSIVVVDEVESFLRKWCFNETLEKNDDKQKCWDANVLLSEYIILLDAFITNVALQFFDNED